MKKIYKIVGILSLALILSIFVGIYALNNSSMYSLKEIEFPQYGSELPNYEVKTDSSNDLIKNWESKDIKEYDILQLKYGIDSNYTNKLKKIFNLEDGKEKERISHLGQ